MRSILVISAVLTGVGWAAAVAWVFWVARLADPNALLFGVYTQPDLSIPVIILGVGAYALTAMAFFRKTSALLGAQIGVTALGLVGVAILVGFQFVTVIGKAMAAALGCAFGCKAANPGFHGEPIAVGTGTLLVLWLLAMLICWISTLADGRTGLMASAASD